MREPSKHLLQRITTERGMQINFSKQSLKHDSPIVISCESGGKSNRSIVADPKHDRPRTSTDRGIEIDFTKQFAKQRSSISDTLDPASNVTIAFSHLFGHRRVSSSAFKTTTDRGITTICDPPRRRTTAFVALGLTSNCNAETLFSEMTILRSKSGRSGEKKAKSAVG
jgi:hypothetical protein